MKIADIVVGGEYALSTYQKTPRLWDATRVKVIEKKMVEGRRRLSPRKTVLVCRVLDAETGDPLDQTRQVSARALRCTWSELLEIEAKAAAREEQQVQRLESQKAKEHELVEILRSLGVYASARHGAGVEIDTWNVEAAIAALRPLADVTPCPLAGVMA